MEHTPWGTAQEVINIARGIRMISTAGHAGILVSPTKNILIPEYMRNSRGAYEEDCEWCKVAIVFEKEWRTWADSTDWTNGNYQMECAMNTFINWFPDEFERFTGKALLVGESRTRDVSLLKERFKSDFVVTAAWGDWHMDVPEGHVAVCAVKNVPAVETKYFMVNADEYKGSSNTRLGMASCFVINQDIHREIHPIQ